MASPVITRACGTGHGRPCGRIMSLATPNARLPRALMVLSSLCVAAVRVTIVVDARTGRTLRFGVSPSTGVRIVGWLWMCGGL
jgi:hypothetical protein